MTNRLKIAIAQINVTGGDIDGNAARILTSYKQASAADCDLVIFHEMCLAGYIIDDLALRPAFVEQIRIKAEELAAATVGNKTAMIIGAPWRDDAAGEMASQIEDRRFSENHGRLFNSALLLDDGEVNSTRHKILLPNTSVFDDYRVFTPGSLCGPMSFRGARLGVMICEDSWHTDVAECLDESGSEILIALNGSPYEQGKQDVRIQKIVARVTETEQPFIFVNQVGGQDELVYDGGSFVLNADNSLAVQMPMFEEGLQVTDWEDGADGWRCMTSAVTAPLEDLESDYAAMTLALRDYVTKNGFKSVLLGLSGGIDSALTAAVAVDALGADAVHAVMMPSPYTSRESLEDAEKAARALGIKLDEIGIGPAMSAFDDMLAGSFEGRDKDLTEENIQARIRGTTLMALSNKFGSMLLTTGNKSEIAVGYSTLYGDMSGGYNVLGDMYKMRVFESCRWRNKNKPSIALGPDGEVVPDRIITKPPSAELRPDQKDEDSLPPYEVLDRILEGYIEDEKSRSDLVEEGFDKATVDRVWRLLHIAEYKRRQAAPAVRLTRRAFGRDRRYPITNRFNG
jgi:NAD+ synthase